MQRAAHEGGLDNLAMVDRLSQVLAAKIVESGPQPDKRRSGELRLHAHQPFHGLCHR